MKVLQLAKFYPPECGGIESVVRELTEGLNRIGWPTDVLCAHRRRRSADESVPGAFRIVRAGSYGMLQSTSLAPSLIGWAQRMVPAYDIVHVHMPNPLAALALWRARPQARIVVHWHSDVISQRLALTVYEPLQRWLLARADAVVVTSQAYADASQALRPWRDKLAVVPLGISDNLRLTDPERVAALRLAWSGRRIIFALGRMAPYKGFDVLIEAAMRLPDDAVVLVGGTGPCLRRHRAHVARLGLGGKVHFLGPIADDDLITYHQAAYVFCMPSLTRAEAFGVAQLEAMSAGQPVVCSAVDGSGLSWVNLDGVTGFTVQPSSPLELAAALRRLLSDPTLRLRLGKAARQRYLEHFTAQAMVDRVAALYRRLVPPLA
jgi:glycosyltransferase involved in cell wall biosynthesis